ncbi:MAG: amidohydrolase [Rhodothermia bacterium]|nr:amidohydrolase [Rhodothermia bacterium]
MPAKTRLLITVVAVVALAAGYPSGARCQATAAMEAFVDAIESKRAELIEIRHDVHRNPELSGMEERTSALVAARLKGLGWNVRERIGGYGVVATLRGTLPGDRVVAFRADMDAVRSQHRDPVDYRSQKRGVRHICGHDVHTTIALALAEGFSSIRGEYGGTVMLLFQPAEETASGANAMLRDDVFATLKPHAIFAVHTAPFQIGQVATTPGGMMASRDRLTVTIRGTGDIDDVANRVRDRIASHSTVLPEDSFGSVPHDAVYIRMQPTLRSGDDVRIVRATVMLADAQVRKELVAALNDGLKMMSDETRVSLEYDRWIYGVTNDNDLTTRAVKVAAGVLGEGNVILLTQYVPAFSEDFGSFQEVTPGTMFFLGVSNEAKGWVGMPHSPDYVADDEAIFVGARTMAAVMLDALDAD